MADARGHQDSLRLGIPDRSQIDQAAESIRNNVTLACSGWRFAPLLMPSGSRVGMSAPAPMERPQGVET